MKIALYVNSSMGANTVPWHTQKCWSAGCNALQNHPIIESSDSVLNPEEDRVKRLVEGYAGKHNIDCEVYDIALKSVGNKARLKLISKTPLLIINGKRTYEMPATEQELALLLTGRKRSAAHPAKTRASAKYLRLMPAKFAAQLGLGFLILLALFRLIESRAASYTAIHDTLPFYVLILTLLPCISGLMAMLATYFEMRLTETRLMLYLEQRGIPAPY